MIKKIALAGDYMKINENIISREIQVETGRFMEFVEFSHKCLVRLICSTAGFPLIKQGAKSDFVYFSPG